MDVPSYSRMTLATSFSTAGTSASACALADSSARRTYSYCFDFKARQPPASDAEQSALTRPRDLCQKLFHGPAGTRAITCALADPLRAAHGGMHIAVLALGAQVLHSMI